MGGLRRGAAASLLGLALAACGTTVPSGLAQPGADGLSVQAGAGAPPVGAGAGPVGSGAGGPMTAAGSRQQQGGSGVAGTPGVAPGAAASRGPAGVRLQDRSPVEVGVNVPSAQAATAMAGLGFAVDGGDPKGMARAMADWVNAHGGLAGRPVRLVFHEQSVTASKQDDEQVSCATFTEDHRVVAAVDSTAPTPSLGACLARKGAVLTGGGASVFSEQDFTAAQGMWGPYLLGGERMVRQLVARLHAMGWFVPGEKIGIVYNESRPFPQLKELVKRELAARGLTVAAEGGYSSADLQQMSAAMNGLALRFKAAGVQRVIPVEQGSQVHLLFIPAAKSQDYHPVYAITSSDVPNTLETLASPDDLEGAAGIGWSPAIDVARSRAPALNPAGRLCADIYAKARVDTKGTLAGAFASGYCDGFLFLHQVFGRAGTVSTAAFRAAASSLGGAYVSPATFASWFGPGRYDGAQRTRDLRYETACSCFRYASAEMPVR